MTILTENNQRPMTHKIINNNTNNKNKTGSATMLFETVRF